MKEIADSLVFLPSRGTEHPLHPPRGNNLSISWELPAIIRGLQKKSPPREVQALQLEVTKGPSSLWGVPSESLCQCSDRDRTLKTVLVFLLALASTKRVRELHCLSCVIPHLEGWSSLSPQFVPEFVAKTQEPSVPDLRFKRFSIPSLKDFVRGDKMVLCLVRAVRHYLKRTASLRPRCGRDLSIREKRSWPWRTLSPFWLR